MTTTLCPAARAWHLPGDRLRPLPWRHRLRLDLVLPRRSLPGLTACAAVLRDALGLD